MRRAHQESVDTCRSRIRDNGLSTHTSAGEEGTCESTASPPNRAGQRRCAATAKCSRASCARGRGECDGLARRRESSRWLGCAEDTAESFAPRQDRYRSTRSQRFINRHVRTVEQGLSLSAAGYANRPPQLRTATSTGLFRGQIPSPVLRRFENLSGTKVRVPSRAQPDLPMSCRLGYLIFR